MAVNLNPSLLDVVKFHNADTITAGALTGTIVELLGSDTALVELADDTGVSKDLIAVPIEQMQVVWSFRPPDTKQQPESEAQRYYDDGMLLLQNGLVSRARDCFVKAFQLEPNLARSLMNSTTGVANQGAFDVAIGLFRLILQLQPQYELARENLAITHLNRGVTYARRGVLDKALEDFNTALFIAGSRDTVDLSRRNLSAVYTQLGLHHVEIRRFDEALNFFMVAVQLNPSENTRKNFGLALVSRLAWKHEGRDVPGEEIFGEAVLMGSSVSECLNAYGATLGILGKISQAKEILEKAIRVDPQNELARKNLTALSSHDIPSTPSVAMWGLMALDTEPATTKSI